MPRERLVMRKIREVLRLRWEKKLSYLQIAYSCRISRETARKYVLRAQKTDLSWPLPEKMLHK